MKEMTFISPPHFGHFKASIFRPSSEELPTAVFCAWSRKSGFEMKWSLHQLVPSSKSPAFALSPSMPGCRHRSI
ncbi:MAG: hypothetical protein R6U39_10070 [Candidatus Aegiribacteria sp.]